MIALVLVFIVYSSSLQQATVGLAIDKTSSQGSNSIFQESNITVKHEQQVRQHEVLPDNRRPIWNIAHMVNSIKELDYRLGKGANAIEVDVTFGKDGDPLYTYHGPPCDCLRHCYQQEDFNEYLRYVREIAIDELDGIGKNLGLLFLDLKLDYLDQRSKARAGRELARSITLNLFLDSEIPRRALLTEDPLVNLTIPMSVLTSNYSPKKRFKLIISVNHVTDTELVYNFLHFFEENNATHLLDRIGFDVGMNDDLQNIDTMWTRFKNSHLNLWQGDGYTNCLSPFYNLERLSRAIVKRNQDDGYPKKVYHWTIDLHDRMRESLRIGVDAIMTNHPERLLTVLIEPEMAHNYRLATLDDDPFLKIPDQYTARSNELARNQRSVSFGGFGAGSFTSLIDVISSWLTYIREIPFLSYPTTTRLLSKMKRQHKQQTKSTEYQIDHSNSNNNNLTSSSSNERISISDTLDNTLVNQSAQTTAYDGPKWYTSLVSNVLVTGMKILMPVPSS